MPAVERCSSWREYSMGTRTVFYNKVPVSQWPVEAISSRWTHSSIVFENRRIAIITLSQEFLTSATKKLCLNSSHLYLESMKQNIDRKPCSVKQGQKRICKGKTHTPHVIRIHLFEYGMFLFLKSNQYTDLSLDTQNMLGIISSQ